MGEAGNSKTIFFLVKAENWYIVLSSISLLGLLSLLSLLGLSLLGILLEEGNPILIRRVSIGAVSIGRVN